MTRAEDAETDLIGEFIQLIGKDATFRLLEATAGTRFYVPMRCKRETELRRIVGHPAAQVLAAHYGGETFRMPLAKAWRARVYHERGLTYAEIALRIGCSETTVFKYLSSAGLTGPRVQRGCHQRKYGRKPGAPRTWRERGAADIQLHQEGTQ